jgi:protein-S-isoprenylcysteine O-methyltransferase Ste14
MTAESVKVWLGFALLALVMGLLIFVPAGTLQYWQGWVFLGIYFGASFLVVIYLIRNDPALLQRRMRGGPTAEKQPAERVIMLFVSLGFISLRVVPALDHRLRWSQVPHWVTILGELLVAMWWLVVFVVFRVNSFASTTVEIAADQRVVNTGPYAIVRHPMYAAGMLLFLGMPLALGSYWGLVVIPMTLPFLIWRLFDEERFLSRNLAGYTEYCAKVRWRLIPGLF